MVQIWCPKEEQCLEKGALYFCKKYISYGMQTIFKDWSGPSENHVKGKTSRKQMDP